MAPREKGFELDLESGGSTSEEDASLELVSSKGPKKKFLSSDLGGLQSSNESVVCTCGIESSSSSEKSGEVTNDSVELLIERNSEVEENQGHMTLAEKTSENEWRRKTNSRNAPKPPRPPRGPSLDAADQKLVREITELAKRKRARIEQRKAAKKMKASKSSSLQSGISAMIITLLFFFVIIFQGISSRSVPNVIMQGSPEPAVLTEGLVSVQFYKSSLPKSTYQGVVED
ncbi:hypothetical protein PRUPE_3G008100 [Prunus persica]|uniref:Uncharacterized protein n=1 Tax=Prunus persica TaxID=3760 RepID=A0A251PTB6_PRUPE|nr:uncharacterized protein LOC18788052 [Prunus persica]XP_020416666.1 uncharacterized protein LOC18788052 [Prunus persica]ONI14782.1 hypothetical protein PRUPE_3G008100 [Prunus persica]ONI14783.1 hypothetical protein PRUPE_3G008100 [Prunus persica]ONI14784.1 hypothetical protein PRUPE_3G008100 [Prunus persica]